jgi:hypothetical protein
VFPCLAWGVGVLAVHVFSVGLLARPACPRPWPCIAHQALVRLQVLPLYCSTAVHAWRGACLLMNCSKCDVLLLNCS